MAMGVRPSVESKRAGNAALRPLLCAEKYAVTALSSVENFAMTQTSLWATDVAIAVGQNAGIPVQARALILATFVATVKRKRVSSVMTKTLYLAMVAPIYVRLSLDGLVVKRSRAFAPRSAVTV